MKRQAGLMRLQKARAFTQRDAEQLSGLTRHQLRKLEEAELVVPQKNPILYTWNQLIFLRILFEFRQDWTFKQLETIFKCSSSEALNDKIIRSIDSSLAALLILESNDAINFQLVADINFENDLQNHKLKKAVESIRNDIRLNDEEVLAIIKHIASDNSEEYSNSRISIKKQTLVIIPPLIGNLKNLAEQLQIENLDLKLG